MDSTEKAHTESGCQYRRCLLRRLARPRWVCELGHAPATRVFGHVMAKMPMPAYFVLPFETLWMRARHGQLNVGDAAPDLVVKKLEDHGPTDLATLWADRPVVLVFGSYT